MIELDKLTVRDSTYVLQMNDNDPSDGTGLYGFTVGLIVNGSPATYANMNKRPGATDTVDEIVTAGMDKLNLWLANNATDSGDSPATQQWVEDMRAALVRLMKLVDTAQGVRVQKG